MRREAGKMVMCEKPLGRSAKESREMVDAVEKARCHNGLVQLPARASVTLPSSLTTKASSAGFFHYRAKFLQDWTFSKDLPRAARASGA